MTGRTPRSAWSGLAHVRPLPGQTGELNGGAGAYALVLALAHDAHEFGELVASEMESLGLFVAELDDVGPFVLHEDDSESVRNCAARLSPEWPVQYEDFHTYPHDEA